jgi:hypothetical protein
VVISTADGNYLVAWYAGAGENSGEKPVAPAAFWSHERPAMAGGRNLYLIAYEDEHSDRWDTTVQRLAKAA